MRRFVVIGQKAFMSNEVRLDDLPGTSGRLDVLVRCTRAALLVSHGVRRDVVVYLVLLGEGPRVLRIDGASAKFLRPDERSLATLFKKALAVETTAAAVGFVEARPGISIARGGLDVVLADTGSSRLFILEETATDAREIGDVVAPDVTFFVGDHLGFDPGVRKQLQDAGARAVSIGPLSVHSEDAIAVLSNELDRRSWSGQPDER
jgi:tRNA (pseudouridine54-N1)-methyltransferase